ncbi:hypothetical protein PR202_gb28118 [Eleusine coracana subsp. coracana]|uniref:Rab-GAP TBC domain-containing protein n=1 Tax=Eleusine coracana subsp. coracana TaxID=191504 RepID=A0AAV5FX18_ELECO|nr:hypothetical protein PR202_gb28118 [Eleusine coracana subsp. coracana]
MAMPGSPARPSFSGLRGARWRADLGVLPGSASVSIDELRRAAADSRRRYANLRRKLLIDPHLSKDEEGATNLVVENPLSQNPESTWGQFFRNAELEKMLNQDLSRLYPELGDFFQTSTCQSMLGRILLVWSLRYPEYGYRQGKSFFSCLIIIPFVSPTYSWSKLNRTDRKNNVQGSTAKIRSLDDLDSDTRDLFLINDAYGAEEQKDHAGGSDSKNACKADQHAGYCSTSCEIKDTLGAASSSLSRSSSTSLSCGTEYDHDSHQVEEPFVYREYNVVDEPDPLFVNSDRTDEATGITNQPPGVMDNQFVQQNILCSADGKLKLIGDSNPIIAGGSKNETMAVGSISDIADKELTRTLRSFADSMVEKHSEAIRQKQQRWNVPVVRYITLVISLAIWLIFWFITQAIETVFQPNLPLTSVDNLNETVTGSEEQAKALAALKELRKISDLLRRI